MAVIINASSVDYADYRNPYRDQALGLASGLSETYQVILSMQGLDPLTNKEFICLQPESLTAYTKLNPSEHVTIEIPGCSLADVRGDTIYWGDPTKCSKSAEAYVFSSEYERNLYGEVTPDSSISCIIPHGIDRDTYSCSDTIKAVDRYLYLAPPDRGLAHMLDIWPIVLNDSPKATLLIGSDLSAFLERVHSSFQDGEDARSVKALLELPGVDYRGLSHPEYIEAVKFGGTLVYPCDPYTPCEFFCDTVLHCLCAGTPVVCSTADSLGELWSSSAITLPITSSPQTWADTLLGVCGGDYWDREEEVSRYNWSSITPMWEELIEELKGERQ